MLDDKADANGAADAPTKPARPGAAAHQRRVHEWAAEDRRRAEKAAERSGEEPSGADGNDG